MLDKLLTVGPAPHARLGATAANGHALFTLALLPAVAAAMWTHGLDALRILLLAAGAAVAVEAVTQKLFRQPIYALDGHALLMGLLFALCMPPTVAWWMVLLGVVFMIVIAKLLFGGLGGYAFHPAMVGVVALTVSWPAALAPVGHVQLGAACPGAVLVGGLALVALRRIPWDVPLAFLLSTLAFAALFNLFQPVADACALRELVTGNVLLAAFFLLTEPTSSPANRLPRVLYAVAAGLMLLLIRRYGVWMDAVPFAVLFGNLFGPLFDRLKPKPILVETTDV